MRIIKRFSKTNIGQKLIGFLFYSITSLISRSIKWEYLVENEKSNIFKSDKKYIFCCWHNRLFLGPHLLPRNRIINALQSSHSDGMVTSVAFKYLGMNVILGSSKKGGMQAFRKMVKCIQLGESIAITPDGPKGPKEKVKEGIIKLAQIGGAKVIAIDKNEQRLQYAKDKIGADHIIKAGNNAIKEVTEITNGDLCTAVFDASGNKYAIESGPKYMSHGGRFVLVGLSKGELTYTHPKVHAKEMTLICSRNATNDDFEHVMRVLDQFPTQSFITHNVIFSEMIEHFDSWLDPSNGVMKATIDFD